MSRKFSTRTVCLNIKKIDVAFELLHGLWRWDHWLKVINKRVFCSFCYSFLRPWTYRDQYAVRGKRQNWHLEHWYWLYHHLFCHRSVFTRHKICLTARFSRFIHTYEHGRKDRIEYFFKNNTIVHYAAMTKNSLNHEFITRKQTSFLVSVTIRSSLLVTTFFFMAILRQLNILYIDQQQSFLSWFRVY